MLLIVGLHALVAGLDLAETVLALGIAGAGCAAAAIGVTLAASRDGR